jgi:hypothetical protein
MANTKEIKQTMPHIAPFTRWEVLVMSSQLAASISGRSQPQLSNECATSTACSLGSAHQMHIGLLLKRGGEENRVKNRFGLHMSWRFNLIDLPVNISHSQ